MNGTAGRRGYLDWLRGVAVLIMIEGHTVDSWTRLVDRDRLEYRWATVVAGFGAPIFLFLAGLALTLAAGSRLRQGASASDAAAAARRRAWQIFGLALLFRLQSLVLSGGSFAQLAKVDILNVMGLAMLGAALVWGLGRGHVSRALLLAAAAAGLAMMTPIVRTAPLLVHLPDPVEWYARAPAGQGAFTLFPWAGFVFAGAAIGTWLDSTRTAAAERRLNLVLAIGGPALAAAGYAASYLPPIYRETAFWTSSPTFFFLRLGVLISAVPVAYAVSSLWPGRSRVREFGAASLFVYWIHVEMVYGLLTLPMHRRLTLEQAALAFGLFTLFLYWLVTLKNRVFGRGRSPKHENQAKAGRLRAT